MRKINQYRDTLRGLDHWDAFLLQASGLPGPRGNLELAQAAADEGREADFLRWLSENDPAQAPTNNPREFLAFCGVVGLGKLVAAGRRDLLPIIHRYAADPRWRMREGVAMALQRLGDVDMAALLAEMEVWSQGTLLEQRAAAAALCEPRLLSQEADVIRVCRVLDEITAGIPAVEQRWAEEFQALRKALGYCWSVVVAAAPGPGRGWMEKWCLSQDKDIIWIMKENLKKQRLARMDPVWVATWQAKLGM